MILNDITGPTSSINSPSLVYRINHNNSNNNNNRHRKNKSSSLVNTNKYASPILNTQSFGRNFRWKKRSSLSNKSAGKESKKKKIITSSEVQQIYPRTISSNGDETSSFSSSKYSNRYPCSTPNSNYSNLNLNHGNHNRQSDSSSQKAILNKIPISRKSSSQKLSYSNSVNHSASQDIDDMSYDITCAMNDSVVESMDSTLTVDSNLTDVGINHEDSFVKEQDLNESNERRYPANRTYYSKRSASLHTTHSLGDTSISSVKKN
jgi:hypothetical protein